MPEGVTPLALTTRTVTAHYERADETPATGFVELVPTTTLASLTENTIVWPAPVRAGLDDTGDVLVDVLVTGTGDLLPEGWVYRLTEYIDGATRPSRLVEVPAGADPLDLADTSPLEEQPDLVSYVLLTAVGQPGGPGGPLDEDGRLPAEQIPAGGGGGSGITSVNGDEGPDVTLTAADVGADPAGTGATAAASAVSTHTAATDPHGDRSFTTSAIATHAAATDPHGDRAAATAALGAHDTDTTNVHGITDTSALETTTGAAAKVTAHAAAVDPHGDRSAATAALTSHENDTTSVHGIADTSALETSAGATAKVSAHTAASDPHADRAFATSAVSTHSAATTSVHGIANTAALETTTGAATKVSTHAGAADPHADRAFTTSAVSTHSGAADPHGDRAYADTRAPLPIIGTVTSDQAAITGTTLTDVAGLGLAIPGAGTYDFDFYVSYTGSVGGSNTTATNPNAILNGPATSFAGYVIEMQISNTTNNIFAKTALASAQAPATNGISTALNPYTVRIRGRIIATGAGTLQPQIARAAGTFTGDIVVKAGSHATARKVA